MTTEKPALDPFSDPDERFDVMDAAGRPTGRTKRRAAVHRDGDWHRTFHCWIMLRDGARPELMLQRRGAGKDTFPLLLDVSVGGHFRAGETLADVVREVEEEVGVPASVADLLPVGRRRGVSETERFLDREIQEVFLWRPALSLAGFRPQPGEVTALEAVAVADLIELLTGKFAAAHARILTPEGTLRAGNVAAADFIPTIDDYFLRVAVLADLAVRSYPYLLV